MEPNLRSLAIISLVVSAACGGSDASSGDGTCNVGEAECNCTPGGGCDPGLTCESDVCVPEGTTSGSGATDTDVTGGDTSSDGGGTRGSQTTGATDSSTGGATSSGTAGSGDQGTPTTGGDVDGNIVFVTSTSHVAGDLGGQAGADAICNARAAEAGLAGIYVAWLSDAQTNAIDKLGTARGWVRTDGKPVVADAADLVAQRFYYPIIYNELGNTVALGSLVLTATTSDGQAADSTGLYCGNWTDATDANTNFPAGRIGGGARYWTEYTGLGCAAEGHLFCFGVDQQHDLEFVPQPGRLAFTARAGLTADAGRAAADAQCQQVADAAGHSGTFLAALAVPGESAADRFDLGGEPWVRLDGIPLFPDSEPMGNVLQAPILYDADGSMLAYSLVWAGATGPQVAGATGTTCNGWSEVTGGAPMGTSWDMSWWNWNISGTDECTVLVGVFCFEE